MRRTSCSLRRPSPGEILKDELEARGLSQRKFASIIGMSYSALNELVNGKRR